MRYPDDPVAVARGDEFLWGPSVLVAPVTEKGAISRRVYLPRGGWYDYWTDERVEGGREIDRKVDLTMIPLYISSGSIVPLGPVKQYVDEPIDEPLTLAIYPGADGEFLLYEDDGKTFGYQTGVFFRGTSARSQGFRHGRRASGAIVDIRATTTEEARENR